MQDSIPPQLWIRALNSDLNNSVPGGEVKLQLLVKDDSDISNATLEYSLDGTQWNLTSLTSIPCIQVLDWCVQAWTTSLGFLSDEWVWLRANATDAAGNSISQTTYKALYVSPIEVITKVYVEPANKRVTIKQNFSIDVDINTSSEIYAFQFDLSFNPSLLNVINVAEGDFLSKDGASTYCMTPIINSTEGKITYACTRFGVDYGVSGSGTLATIDFNAVSNGTSSLDLEEVLLSDSNLTAIPALVEDGKIEIRLLEGDVDNNCVVNVFDLARVGLCYGKLPTNYCLPADLNLDNKIDILDLALVGINFGRVC